MSISENILYDCYENNIIPHLILIGNKNIPKKNIIDKFIDDYYQDNQYIKKTQVLNLDIVIDKSIKKIRETIKKFINKTCYFDDNNNILLKFIILHNIEFLTFEIQYALRRIIEDNNKKIRFIFIGTNSKTMIQPLISRCLLLYFNNYYPLVLKKNIIDWENYFHNKNIKDLYKNFNHLFQQNFYYYEIINHFMDWIMNNEFIHLDHKLKLFKFITFKFTKICNKGDIFLNLFSIILYYNKLLTSINI